MTDFSDKPVWNKAGALGRLMNNETLLYKVTDLYLSSTPCQLESLKQSVASSNLTSAQAEAHTLKGASGNIGAEQMMELFAAIEAAAGEEQMQEVEALLKQVDDSYRRLESELRS